MSETCPKCGAERFERLGDDSGATWHCFSFQPDGSEFQQSGQCRHREAEKDAVRYRFIRDRLATHSEIRDGVALWGAAGFEIAWHPSFDAAIDAMMKTG